MLFRRFLVTLLVACLAGGTLTAAPKRKSASTKAAKSKSKRTAKSRRAPKQMQPTQERYIEIQEALSKQGYYEGPLDGVWSQECVAALKRFQKDQNLEPDGKLGSLSLIALGLGPKREVASEFNAKPAVAP